jgi:putative methyltransferase (TIGR04325 family)
VLAQTYQRFEVIVVGDAAPEAAKDAVESFGDPRLSFHNLELRGPYPADPERRWLIAGGPPFNEAVRRARGEWIAPLDDDDAFRPDHIEALLEAARQRRLEFVYGRIAQHEPGGNLTELGLFPPELGQINLQAALYRADLRDIFGLELADALFGEPNDWAVCQRMMRSGVRLGMIDHLVVDYYPSSAWGRSANENERDAPLVTGAAEVSDEPSAAEWTYAPQGWAHELENGGGPGWDGSSVARMYAERWPAFLQNLKGNGPLGALHVVPLGQPMPREDLTSHNMAMVFAYALGLSAHMTDTLSILDWGGGLGHFHELARALVPDLKLDYHCKELPEVCEQGRRVSPEVTFHESRACLEHSYDLVLASGAIQYAEHWEELLGQLSSATRRYLLLTKVPITGAQSFVVLQRAHAYGYDTEYLGWALNSGEVRAAAQNAGLDLVREFFLSATVEVPNAPGSFQHAGFLFTPQQNARP